ncbi:MAG: tRNA dihydrouridine(20/20a) synthase DusA, partial [Pseudomonadota bacterium]
VTAPALVRGGARHLLRFDAAEHPVALQLGGSDPAELAEAAAMGAGEGYDEINLNVGCPSDRVQSGTFGAVLMKTPEVVARCVAAMAERVDVPVTVKCRIGVDDQEPRDVLPEFLQAMRSVGISRVAIHARKAWLKGLSPKENREVPPLDYELVYEMKRAFPDLHISINGGVGSLAEARAHLAQGLDGAMIGRAAYNAPWEVLGAADGEVFGAAQPFDGPHDVVLAMVPYIERHLADGGRLHSVTRHMLGLFSGRPGARRWRQVLSSEATGDGAGVEVLMHALDQVPRDTAA